ncbi:hypothetical protein PIB30_054567 [Stylosanthes scabra]|uniref:Uncharacterized protein n=1 Tax=Stylosanthes scabra TaxID=79078 RepID=A0ABU6TIK8_9FABA|nr:hypothetical protein [Stylosanthes scabra]
MEEAETSRVRETQQATPEVGDEELGVQGVNGPAPNVSCGPEGETYIGESPIRTVMLEDDRRTKDVIQEWEDSRFHLPERNCGSEELLEAQNVDHNLNRSIETGSSTASAPPSFEYARVLTNGSDNNNLERERGRSRERKRGKRRQTRKKSLKLIEQVKEKARRKKDGRRRKKEDDEEWGSQEEIEATESDKENTWWVGTKTGLRAEAEDTTKKYLRTKEEGAKEIEKGQGKSRNRQAGNKVKEVGAFKNCLQ